MGRFWWDVEVEIHRFDEGPGGDRTIGFDSDVKVEKTSFSSWWIHLPW
jgi:hypothetical protein